MSDAHGGNDIEPRRDGRVETYGDLARRIRDRPSRLAGTRLVAVDGPSGSGKTHFAARLAVALGNTALVVHTDDLLDGWDDQFTFWTRLEEWVLDPLRVGHSGHYRRYDWTRGCFGQEWIEVPPVPVLILEGVSTARASIRPELTFAVFVAAPEPVREARALVRDGEDMLPYLDRWRRRERGHFAADATVDEVDLVVDGAPDVPHDPEVSYVRLGPRQTVYTAVRDGAHRC